MLTFRTCDRINIEIWDTKFALCCVWSGHNLKVCCQSLIVILDLNFLVGDDVIFRLIETDSISKISVIFPQNQKVIDVQVNFVFWMPMINFEKVETNKHSVMRVSNLIWVG